MHSWICSSRVISILMIRPLQLYAKAVQLLPSIRFKIGSSKDLDIDFISSPRHFSTQTIGRAAAVKVQPSKEKLARKLVKLDKKREIRAVRKVELGTKLAQKKVINLQVQRETQHKLETAKVRHLP